MTFLKHFLIIAFVAVVLEVGERGIYRFAYRQKGEKFHEITTVGRLLDSFGALKEPGFSRKYLLEYNRKDIWATPFGIKEWDYYAIISQFQGIGILLTVSDLGYCSAISATVITNLLNKEVVEFTDTLIKPLSMGSINLPNSPLSGSVSVSFQGANFTFLTTQNNEKQLRIRHLIVDWPSFGGNEKVKSADEFKSYFNGTGLFVDVFLTENMKDDSIVVATPFQNSYRMFYYNQKVNCMHTTGFSNIGSQKILLNSQKEKEDFSSLDWGRGVWPYSESWLWASASCSAKHEKLDGSNEFVDFGMNFGYGFGDLLTHTENAVFVNGKLHKLGRVLIDYNSSNWLQTWNIKDDKQRVDISLHPKHDRVGDTNLFVVSMLANQVFGTWTGFVSLDDGSKIILDQNKPCIGWSEFVSNRW